jgi:hypothetical protein
MRSGEFENTGEPIIGSAKGVLNKSAKPFPQVAEARLLPSRARDRHWRRHDHRSIRIGPAIAPLLHLGCSLVSDPRLKGCSDVSTSEGEPGSLAAGI